MRQPFKDVQDRRILNFFVIKYNRHEDERFPRTGPRFDSNGFRTFTTVQQTEEEAVFRLMALKEDEYVKIHAIGVRLQCFRDGTNV